MTQSREMMIDRAREFQREHRDCYGIGVQQLFELMSDFAIEQIERYKESLAKDAGREEEEGEL